MRICCLGESRPAAVQPPAPVGSSHEGFRNGEQSRCGLPLGRNAPALHELPHAINQLEARLAPRPKVANEIRIIDRGTSEGALGHVRFLTENRYFTQEGQY